jgi:hypothetical protein
VSMTIKKLLVIICFLAGIIFLGHYTFSGHAIYGDGIDYWVYLPSVYFDHDIDFENQYKHYFEPISNNLKNSDLSPVVMKTGITEIGKVDNVHPPGNAIIWAPAFITADCVAAIFSLPRQGYSDIYQIIVGLWSIGIVAVGLWFNYQVIFRLIKDKNISLLSTLAVFFLTPLLYYGAYDVLNSHFASYSLTSIFWYILLFLPNKPKTQITLGAIIGLATLVRFQEGLLLIPVLIFFHFKKYRLSSLFNVFLTWLTVISPLFFIWEYLYGIPLPTQYIYVQTFARPGNILGSIFHPVYGMIRTPILIISVFWLKKFMKKYKNTAMLMTTYFLLQFILTALLRYWNGPAYGARAYISTLPFFAVLIAYFLKAVSVKFGYKSAIVVVSAFALINAISIFSFVFFEKEVNSGVKRGLEEKTQIKVNNAVRKFTQYFYKE